MRAWTRFKVGLARTYIPTHDLSCTNREPAPSNGRFPQKDQLMNCLIGGNLSSPSISTNSSTPEHSRTTLFPSHHRTGRLQVLRSLRRSLRHSSSQVRLTRPALEPRTVSQCRGSRPAVPRRSRPSSSYSPLSGYRELPYPVHWRPQPRQYRTATAIRASATFGGSKSLG